MQQTAFQPMRHTGRPIAIALTILGLTLGLTASTTVLAAADDEFNHITGTSGDDRLRGTAAADDIRGERGDDRLWGYVGPDVLSGGPGADTLHGGAGVDGLYGRSGADFLHAGAGTDHLEGGRGNDFLSGGRGADHLIGGAGHDNIENEIGRDRIALGAGNDSYVDWEIDGMRDEIWCGPGDDFVGYWGDPDPADTLHGCERVGNIAH